ncbi:MAG: diacylglycerol kinase family lipid kinase [Dehalococcoidales bacterium]|nr:diacylglycerol kinase family lipid kinase [Dehalococcoidales bacterium]
MNQIQAAIIYNPHGGQVVLRHELQDVAAFLRQHGWAVTLQETTGPNGATELASRAVREGAKIVIAAGGDGTVSEVANGLLNTDAALGVLPVGTTNSWALQMGIPALNPWLPSAGVARFVANLEERMESPIPANYYRKVLLDAARLLVEGRTVAVDVGQVSGRHFLMWAGIGMDAEVLESVSPVEKAALGSWAYVLNAITAVGRRSSTNVRLSIDGKTTVVNTPLIIVSNIQLYGGIVAIGANARINDGKLDVCIFKGDGFFTFAQHALKVLSRQHLRDPNIEYYQCRELVIEPARTLPVHLDGEPFTETPVVIRTIPLALKVIVSNKKRGDLFGPQ